MSVDICNAALEAAQAAVAEAIRNRLTQPEYFDTGQASLYLGLSRQRL